MTRTTRLRIAFAAAVLAALVAGVLWGLGAGDDEPASDIAADVTTTTVGEQDDDDDTDEADDETGATGDADSDDGAGSGTPATATPSLERVALSSAQECTATIAPQVVVTVDGSTPSDTGTQAQQELADGAPRTVMAGRTLDGDAGDDHTVSVFFRDHLSGSSTNRTHTTAGAKSDEVAATSDHVEWALRYRLTFADGSVEISDVVLAVTGCQETVVPQLFVTVERSDGTTDVVLDTGSSRQLTLEPGAELELVRDVDLGADVIRVEVRLFEHFFGRAVSIDHGDDGRRSVNVPINAGADHPWTLVSTVDGLDA